MPSSEPVRAAAPTRDNGSSGSNKRPPRKRLQRSIGFAGYWVRRNSRLLTRIAAAVFAVAVIWATVVWLRAAFDRWDPCAGLVPVPTSCDPPASALRALQLGIALLGALVAVAAAVLAVVFAVVGREPRREPPLLRPLVVVFLLLLIMWLTVVILSGGTTITIEPGSA